MSRYISSKNRLFVQSRANQCCEYCRMPELFSIIGFTIDHIISIKHGGSNDLSNLALACAFCNYFKGTDLGTILLPDQQLIRFFNPRGDKWDEHFQISEALILPKTDIGKTTVKIFQFNNVERILERESLINAGLFPPSSNLYLN